MTQSVSNLQGGHIKKSTQRPYNPSWVNQMIRFVDGLKVPSTIFYLVFWTIFFIILTLLRWNEGVNPTGTLNPSDVVMSATGIFFIVLIQYLDQWAIKKMQVFRETMTITDQEFEGLVYQISTLPAHPTIIASFITLSFGTATFLLSPAPMHF